MTSSAPAWIEFGTAEYRRTGIAFFVVGFATFSMLYCVQPLLPLFAADFSVSPAESSLTLSLATGMLAFSVAAAAAFSQAIGRRGVMFASMGLAAMFHLIAGIAPGWYAILAARALEGLVLGVVYLSVLVNPKYPAAQYAFLAGFAFLLPRLLAGASASIQGDIGYDGFFLLSGVLSLAALLFLPFLKGDRIVAP